MVKEAMPRVVGREEASLVDEGSEVVEGGGVVLDEGGSLVVLGVRHVVERGSVEVEEVVVEEVEDDSVVEVSLVVSGGGVVSGDGVVSGGGVASGGAVVSTGAVVSATSVEVPSTVVTSNVVNPFPAVLVGVAEVLNLSASDAWSFFFSPTPNPTPSAIASPTNPSPIIPKIAPRVLHHGVSSCSHSCSLRSSYADPPPEVCAEGPCPGAQYALAPAASPPESGRLRLERSTISGS